jgi:CRP-like cAMP-binding protein
MFASVLSTPLSRTECFSAKTLFVCCAVVAANEIGDALLIQTSPPRPHPVKNVILAGLEPSTLEAVRPHLMWVDLPQGFCQVKPDEPIEYLYFIEQGLASSDALSSVGRSVEVGVIGREGVVGYQALLGQDKTSNIVLMQGAGAAWRLRVSIARQELLRDPTFLGLFHEFLASHIAQISQSVLCNRLHEAENRLARWMLMASDHMRSDTLGLTQEFISQMLGSTRSTVTITAGALQDAGMISYSRGKIHILDRPALEGKACECYAVVRSQELVPVPA